MNAAETLLPPVPLILDSGATTLYNKYVKKETKGAPGIRLGDRRHVDDSFYKTQMFQEFRERYIEFVLEHDAYLEEYINLDVINNAEASYESLKYMESRGCHPLPVWHIGCGDKWLARYIDEGYKFICIGGLTNTRSDSLVPMLDRVWSHYLVDDDGMPIVRVHGLACTSFLLMRRYPWYSVDSATWTKMAAWGGVYFPRTIDGQFDLKNNPIMLHISEESGRRRPWSRAELIELNDKQKKTRKPHHFLNHCSRSYRPMIERWLNHIGIPLGGDKQEGVMNNYEMRMRANLAFFQAYVANLSKWPWPFVLSARRRAV